MNNKHSFILSKEISIQKSNLFVQIAFCISWPIKIAIFHSPCQYSHMRTMLFLYIPLADCCCALPLRALRKGVCECLLQQRMKRLFYLRGYVNIH